MPPDLLEPIAIPPEAGRVLPGLGVRHKLRGKQTGGALYLFDSEFGPGEGNRLHVHRYEDELGYVLEGALAVQVGGQTLEVRAGGIAYLPKNIPHKLTNPLNTPSRYLFAAIPGGYIEHWFDEIEAARERGELDEATHRELSLKYGIEWLE